MKKSDDKKFALSSKYHRHFSEAFKREKVSELKQGLTSVSLLSRAHGVTRKSIYNWLYLYGQVEACVKTVVQMESEEQKTKLLMQRVAELERAFGQKQLEVDVLNKTLELASAELGYDLKKKHAPPSWNGSVTT